MIGRTIGKYRVTEQLGRGGMGTVYKAVDESLGRDVAIKVLNADIIEADAIERFRREALTLARLNHPRIAAIHELTRDGHDLLMVMEMLTGETCERLIERAGPMPLPHAVKLCSQVLDALQYAHKAGVVHRDLKPANIIVTPNGDVKVMDFGIARVQGSEHLTTNGFMVGTPAYMPPEQVRGEEVDPRMDLYSITVVLYRMLTHKLPFQGDTAVAMIHSQLHNPPTPPRQFRADLPEWMDQVLIRGLMKAPSDRFQSALEFRNALEAGLSGKGQPRRPVDLEETIGPTPTPGPMPAPSASTPRPAAAASVSAPKPPRTDALPAPLYSAPTPQASQTVTLKTPHLATAAVLVGAVALGALAIAFIALRRSAPEAPAPVESVANTTTPAGASPSASTTPAAPAITTPAAPTPPPTPAAPTVSAPAAPGAAAVPGTAASGAAPAAARPAAPTPAPSTAASTDTAPRPATTGRRGAGAATDPAAAARGATPLPATPAVAAAPAAPSAPSTPDFTTETFDDVRLLVVEGGKSREVETELALAGSRIEVRADWDKSVLRSIAYSSATSLTYVRGRRPRGQSGPNIAPVPDIGGGGIFGGARHWMTVQTAGEFLILRLEDRNVVRVLMQLEARTGQTVHRER